MGARGEKEIDAAWQEVFDGLDAAGLQEVDVDGLRNAGTRLGAFR
ncbi:hypothetical protein [Streptomyces gilvifuscus]